MRATEKIQIDDAAKALQTVYEPGDDGYPVSRALDSLAKVLADKTDRDLQMEDALTHLLEKLKAPSRIRTGVKKLYKNAAGGEYGLGLSKKQARTINEVVEDIVDPLVDFIESRLTVRVLRSDTRSRPAAKRRKR